MKFFCTIDTFGSFNCEMFIRALNGDAKITRTGKMRGWFSREDLDRIEEWGLRYVVHY